MGTLGILKHLSAPGVQHAAPQPGGPRPSGALSKDPRSPSTHARAQHQQAEDPEPGVQTDGRARAPRTPAAPTTHRAPERPLVLPFALGADGKLCPNTTLVKQTAVGHGEEENLGKGENSIPRVHAA